MNYPLISEYIDAILSPEDNLSELANLRPVIGSDNQPFFTSGNFAVVFKMTDGKKNYALKCFTKDLQNRESNYQLIDCALKGIKSPHLIPFKYIANEIFVDSTQTSETEFPVILMDWVEGITLSQYLKEEQHILVQDSNVLPPTLLNFQSVFISFIYLCKWLLKAPFAHGDLKPENIIIDKNGICVLIDYDNMYVPEMSGKPGMVCATPNYRHPDMSYDYGKQIDFYAISIISLSLKAYSLNPTLLSPQHEMIISENEIPFFYNKSFLRDEKLMTDMGFVDLFSLYLHVVATNDIDLEHFNKMSVRLLIPKNYDYTDTKVKDKELEECIIDEYGVKYSLDGTRLLKGNPGLSEYIVRDGVLTICDQAFQSSNLISLILPESLLSIGQLAFANSENLDYCNLPSEVIYIKDNNPWGGCFSISMLDCKSKNFSIINGILYSADFRILYGLIYWNTKNIQVHVHKSTRVISSNAFWSNRSHLHHIKLIVFDNVEEIGKAAFFNCEDAKFEINRSPYEIGEKAFENCENLTHINIDKLSTLNEQVFMGCNGLVDVTLSKNLKFISPYAFEDCESLTEITLFASLQFISNDAFAGCKNLREIKIDNDNEYYHSENGVLYNKNLTKILLYPQGKQDIMFHLPKTIKEISSWCFENNNFVESIYSEGKITTCGEDIVFGCSNLIDFNVGIDDNIDSESFENLTLSLLSLHKINKSNTIELIQKFAAKNDPLSQYLLASYYKDPKYNSISDNKYIYWLKKAAENEYNLALSDLSEELLAGKRIQQNISKAFSIASRLDKLGQSVAIECRGKFYLTLAAIYENEKKYMDLVKAFEYYKKCADHFSNSFANYNVGRCYENGIGIGKDIRKAISFYEKARFLPIAAQSLKRINNETDILVSY